MSKTQLEKLPPLRTLSFSSLLDVYTTTVRQSWDWRSENPSANAGHSPLYQRERRLKRELLARFESSRRNEKYPPISPDTEVVTTKPNLALRKEWTDEGWNVRKWGVQGTVVTHHDSHGLSYEVRHFDGTVGHYDPSELKVAM